MLPFPKGTARTVSLKEVWILRQSKNSAGFEIKVNTHKSILSSIQYVKNATNPEIVKIQKSGGWSLTLFWLTKAGSDCVWFEAQ